MAPTKRISKEKWREYYLKRKERIKNDPVLAALEAEKEKMKRERKKAKKQVKLIGEMTEREKRIQRKEWRQRAKKSYEKKKVRQRFQSYLDERSPPLSEAGDDAPAVQPPPVVDARITSGRKKVKKGRSKRDRLLKREIEKNEKLMRENAKLRQRLSRLNRGSRGNKNSPRKVVSQILKRGNKREIRKKLIFAEAIKHQLHDNYNQLKGRKKKREFGQIVAGNAKILKRYRVLTHFGTISSKVFQNLPNNNSQLEQRTRKINHMVKVDIQTFFEDDESSMACPGKKDCITKHGIKKQKRVLSDTLKNLHAKFLKTVDYKISYSSFCKFKPFWVVFHHVSERDTCMCKTCANIKSFVKALSKSHIIDCSDPKELACQICCDVHNVDCLQRTCHKCKKLFVSYMQFDQLASIKYKQWQVVTDTFLGKNKTMQTVRHVIYKEVVSTFMEAVDIFEKDFKKYLFHEGNIIHQFRKIKALKANLSENEVLIHSDFSENYSMKYSSEIQAFHFGGSRAQYTLHTSQIYFKKGAYSDVTSRSMCTLSESLDHGPAAVWAHIQPILDFIKSTVPHVQIIHFLTDSPATQYRNKTIFYLIGCALKQSIGIAAATWNYLEAGHGKGAPDGVGGCLKRTADQVVARGGDIDSFTRFVEVLKENVRNVFISTVDNEEIRKMKEVIPPTIHTFKGTMKVHQVVFRSETPERLTMRRLSCFHEDCKHYFLGFYELPNAEPDDSDECPILRECEVDFVELSVSREQGSASSQPLEADLTECSVKPPKKDSSAQMIFSGPSTSASKPTVSSCDLKPGTYILASFQNQSKKTTSAYSYVCSIEKINEDRSIVVNGFRRFNKSSIQFQMKDNDLCVITLSDVLEVLPDPVLSLKNRRYLIYTFPQEVNVREQ